MEWKRKRETKGERESNRNNFIRERERVWDNQRERETNKERERDR